MFSLSRRLTRLPSSSSSAAVSIGGNTIIRNANQQQQAAAVVLQQLFTSIRHQSSSSSVEAEINDVANCFRIADSNKIPLGKVIHNVTPGTKSKIFKSGKGLEGYLRQFPSAFAVEKVGNDKFLLLVDERLRQTSSSGDNGGGEGSDATSAKKTTTSSSTTATSATPGDISGMAVQRIRPPLSEKTIRRHEFRRMQREKEERRYQEKIERQEREAREREEKMMKKASGGVSPSSFESSNNNTSSGGSQMWVDEILQQEKDAKVQKENAAKQQQEKEKESTSTSGDDQQQEQQQQQQPPQQQDAGDQNPELTSRVKACLSGENQWYKIQAIHASLYKGTAVQLSPFMQFLINAPKHFWTDPKNGYVTRRLAYHTQPPPNSSLRAVNVASVNAAKPPSSEWGEARNAPTAQDVYEILRYIPIHWTEFGSIQIPDTARKKHIRISSKLTWFARQPRFFDLRWIGGTIEIRRAPVLHPNEHGLTKAEAEQMVQHRIEEDSKLGQPLVLLQARGIQPVGSSATTGTSGGATSADPSPSSSSSTAATTTTSTTTTSTGSSSNVDAVTKALVRIAPGYFVTAEAIMRRATKKMTDNDLAFAAERVPLMVERLVVQSKTNPKHSISLYRRKLGVDDSTWKPEFIKELEESPNLKLLGSLMTHMCAQWDRTHFLYVRLPDIDKVESGGFDEMVNFLRLHPQTFRTGEYFVKRNDLSDPTGADADPEPTSKMVLNTKQLEDNPYHQLIDLANVFHYLIPEGESVTLSHFVDSSSPAMRSVLPPRILTILQAYPEKFNCREIAPGTYTVSRIQQQSQQQMMMMNDASGGSAFTTSSTEEGVSQQQENNNANNNNNGETEEQDQEEEQEAQHHDEFTAQVASMTKEDAVEKLIAIVPPRGVDIAHIETTMPQTLKRGIVRLFGAGGVASLVAENLDRFHVVKNPPYQTIFVRQQKQ